MHELGRYLFIAADIIRRTVRRGILHAISSDPLDSEKFLGVHHSNSGTVTLDQHSQHGDIIKCMQQHSPETLQQLEHLSRTWSLIRIRLAAQGIIWLESNLKVETTDSVLAFATVC